MSTISKIIHTLAKTILVFGSIHVFSLLVYAVVTGNWQALRATEMLGVSVIYPQSLNMPFVEASIWILVTGVFALFYARGRK